MQPGGSSFDEKDLGKRVQAARRAAGFTQQTLCQKAELSYSTLAKIERGAIKSPSIFTIQTIAGVLGVSLDSLVGSSSTGQIKQRQKSKSGTSFVYFDINGCLVHFYHEAFNKLAHDSGQSVDVVETAFWHYNDAICRGKISIDEFNHALAKRLGVPSVNWPEYYMNASKPMPEMQKLVSWVSEHYGLGLLTNIMPGQLQQLLSAGLLPRVNYDAIIDSSEVHAIKPETKIYEEAQKRAGCPANEILFIDDSRANLMAAEKFGWHVMWFDDLHPEQSTAHIREALELAD